jgi:hypothetical protein
MSRRETAVAALVALAAAGCGAAPPPPGAPLGRSIAAAPHRRTQFAPAPVPRGDPPPERDGKIPTRERAAGDTVTAAAVASSPQRALRRYALAYTNWRATGLRRRERQLAAISIGAAKLTAEQTATAQGDSATLIASRVANAGRVVAIARGEGPDAGWWVIVTLEHTTGTGPYAGLPLSPHVTVARVTRVERGWVVSAWNPAS